MIRQSKKGSLRYAIIALAILFVGGQSASLKAQVCVQPPANIVSWWRAEGNALDVQGVHNGTLQSGASYAGGRVGQAFSFDGINDAVSLGNQSGLQPTSISIEAWVKFGPVDSGAIENVFAKWGFDATVDSYLLGVLNDGSTHRLFGAIGDGSTGDPGIWGGEMTVDTWHHVAMTYNQSDGMNKLYVNGVEVASRTRPNGIFPTSSIAYFARQDSDGRILGGLIDELAVYSRALSGAEVLSIFNAGTAGKCSGGGSPSGASYSQKQKLQPSSLAGNRGFGNAVAIDGNTMVVGASLYDTTPTTEVNRGTAYVFVQSGGVWTQQAQLLANDGAAGDEFGHSVAISGETIVVGAFRSNSPATNSGAAYVFTRSGTSWSQQQKLTANDGAADDEFGYSVAISGDMVAVGAQLADQPNGGGSAGAIYAFNRSGTTWTQAQKMIPTGTVLFGDYLGASLAMSGDNLVAGAPGDDEPASDAGTIYIYTRNGASWGQPQKLTRLDGTAGDGLGSDVAIDGNTIVAAAFGDTPVVGEPNRGSVFVYGNSGGGFSQQQHLTASDAGSSDYFGWSLAIRGDVLAIGARFDDTTSGADAGSAYIFRRGNGTWTERQKIVPNDPVVGDRFGASAALGSNGTLAIGADEKDLPNGQGNSAGALYVFKTAKPGFFDFDGDGKTDVGIFRPSLGEWWISRSSNGVTFAAQFGASTDTLVPGDYTGDGKTDIAVYRPSTGEWYILRSEDSSFYSVPFGTSSDIPAPADFDADGKADLAVFRPSSGTWFIQRSSEGVLIVGFGANGDQPVTADYDGDGKSDIAIYRPSVGQWWLNRSSEGTIAYSFGTTTDKVVAGDYTGDGKTDIGIWRPSNGNWFVLRSEDNSFYSVPFGMTGDQPAPGDYDGDGRFDPAVYRPTNSTWFISLSSGGTTIVGYGSSGDVPIPNVFVR